MMRDKFYWSQSSVYIPEIFRNVDYNYRAARFWIPNLGGHKEGFPNGANCHHWANELLRHHGLDARDMFSDDLHADAMMTESVTTLMPLDLVMVNRQNRAWGAHIGVYVGPNLIAHLSKENKNPVLVGFGEFVTEYGFFIGAKRCRYEIAPATPQPRKDEALVLNKF